VCSAGEGDGDALVVCGNRHAGGAIKEPTGDLARLGTLVAAQGLRKLAVDAACDDGEQHVEVDVERDRRREGVEVEETDGIGETVLDQHSPRVARDDRLERRRGVVGEQDGRLIVSEIANEELTQCSLVAGQLYALVEDAWRVELAVRNIEFDRPPRRPRQRRDFGAEGG